MKIISAKLTPDTLGSKNPATATVEATLYKIVRAFLGLLGVKMNIAGITASNITASKTHLPRSKKINPVARAPAMPVQFRSKQFFSPESIFSITDR